MDLQKYCQYIARVENCKRRPQSHKELDFTVQVTTGHVFVVENTIHQRTLHRRITNPLRTPPLPKNMIKCVEEKTFRVSEPKSKMWSSSKTIELPDVFPSLVKEWSQKPFKTLSKYSKHQTLTMRSRFFSSLHCHQTPHRVRKVVNPHSHGSRLARDHQTQKHTNLFFIVISMMALSIGEDLGFHWFKIASKWRRKANELSFSLLRYRTSELPFMVGVRSCYDKVVESLLFRCWIHLLESQHLGRDAFRNTLPMRSQISKCWLPTWKRRPQVVIKKLLIGVLAKRCLLPINRCHDHWIRTCYRSDPHRAYL